MMGETNLGTADGGTVNARNRSAGTLAAAAAIERGGIDGVFHTLDGRDGQRQRRRLRPGRQEILEVAENGL